MKTITVIAFSEEGLGLTAVYAGTTKEAAMRAVCESMEERYDETDDYDRAFYEAIEERLAAGEVGVAFKTFVNWFQDAYEIRTVLLAGADVA